MEGEPDLPAPPPPESKFLEPNPSRPINTYPDSVNISRSFNTTSISTTSSSSSSPPEFVRHMQAAFKRHRPLGTMQSNVIKPRRYLVPQQETAENESNLPHDVLLGPRLRGSIPQANTSGDNNEDAEISQPPDFRSGINDAGAEPINAVARVQKKVQFSSENIAPSQGANDRMSTGTDDLLSHMNSLALTETDWDVGNQVDTSAAAKQEWLHHRFQSAEINSNNLIRSEGSAVSSVLARRNLGVQDQFNQFERFLQSDLNNVMTQSSVAGSSCSNSTLINLASAPMISSTTYSSQHQTGVVQPPNPLSRHAGGLPSHDSHHQLSMASQPIISNADIPMEVNKSSGPSKDHDIAKDSCHEENNLVKGNVMEIKSQPPSSSVPTSDVKSEKSKLERLEKGGGGKSASTSRRRGYDPDLFFKVNGKFYQRLGKIGSGGSSEVHKVISSDCMIYALKKIKLKGRDYATAYGFCQEIEYLNRLKGKSNVIQLVDYEVTDKTLHQEVMNGSMCSKDGRVKDDGYIYMVLEYGEIDLAHMLSQKWKELEGSNAIIDENWLRFYWQQILLAVNTIHAERIVHSDLKPANFLLVRGSLKLIDFGIAKAIMCDTTNIQRDSQVGTLSYMSPEAFMCNETDSNGNTIKCGRSSDIWSLGCILYQMVYGRTPFSEYKTFWAKFKVITDPSHEIVYEPVPNPWLLDLMKKCLAWDRNERWRIPQLLQHPFLVPPIFSKLISPVKERHTLFQSIAESNADDHKALMLCNELQSMVIRPSSEVGSDSLISREELGELLCKISEACIQLQDKLAGM